MKVYQLFTIVSVYRIRVDSLSRSRAYEPEISFQKTLSKLSYLLGLSTSWIVFSLRIYDPNYFLIQCLSVGCRFLLVCSCALMCRGSEQAAASTSSTLGVLQGVRSVYRTYKQCETDASVLGCLKLRAIRLLERATTLETIPVADGELSIGLRWISSFTSDSQDFCVVLSIAMNRHHYQH